MNKIEIEDKVESSEAFFTGKFGDKGVKAYPGVALTAVALVVVILFGIMGTFLLYVSSSGGLSAAGYLNGHKAYYIANAGIEFALAELKSTSSITDQTVTYDGGEFTITNMSLTDTTYRLSSTGTIGKYTRNIQMDYYFVNVLPTYFEGASMSWNLVEWEEDGSTQDVSGTFDGKPEPVISGENNEPLITSGSGEPFTLAAWIRLDSIWTNPNTRMVIVSLYQDQNRGYALYLDGDLVGGEVYAQVGIRYGDYYTVATNSNVNDREWHLVAGVAERNGNNISTKIYVDAVLFSDMVERAPGNPVTGSVDSYSIGGWDDTGTSGDYFNGVINSVGVYDQVELTQEELQQIYQQIPDTSGTPGYTIIQVSTVSEF